MTDAQENALKEIDDHLCFLWDSARTHCLNVKNLRGAMKKKKDEKNGKISGAIVYKYGEDVEKSGKQMESCSVGFRAAVKKIRTEGEDAAKLLALSADVGDYVVYCDKFAKDFENLVKMLKEHEYSKITEYFRWAAALTNNVAPELKKSAEAVRAQRAII